MSILDIESTTVVDTIPKLSDSVKTGDEEDEENLCIDTIITFTLDPSNIHCITSHKSGLLCTWNLSGKVLYF